MYSSDALTARFSFSHFGLENTGKDANTRVVEAQLKIDAADALKSASTQGTPLRLINYANARQKLKGALDLLDLNFKFPAEFEENIAAMRETIQSKHIELTEYLQNNLPASMVDSVLAHAALPTAAHHNR